MIRRSILPPARPTLLWVMLSLAAVPMAYGQDAAPQDATTQERLDRIERDLSMLQRQVYRDGGDETPSVGQGGSVAVTLQVRMDRLEQQMRDLTGRVEDMTNDVDQLRRRLEQVNSDIDVRLSQGGGPAAPGAATAAGGPPLGDAVPAYRRPRPPEGMPTADQSANFGTLTPPGIPPGASTGPAPDRPYPGSTGSLGQAASAGSLRSPGNGTLPSASASSQYNAAFGLLRRADYPAAEDALRSFIEQYPTSPLAGNAQYWLGESFYVRGRYADAAAAFAEGYKRYPRGPKAADGLLKLGMSLARTNQKHNACIALMQLDHQFPHPGSAIKDRSAQEKKRLGC